MDSTAIRYEKIKTLDQLLPARGPNIYTSGLRDNEKGFVKYGPASSSQPTLIITDPIYDDDGNGILPGYYELMLSSDRQNLLLTQRQTIIAIIPVFKIEEDKSQEQSTQPMDYWSQRKYDKEEKKKQKKKEKLIRLGKMTDEPEIYNKANIQYDVNGSYYLIEYERGAIRAWGTLKI